MKKTSYTGLILSAGKGERLKPLTEKVPKPLVKVDGNFLIEHPINWFKQGSVEKILINLWYKKDKLKNLLPFLEKKYAVRFILSEEEELMGTGGGIIKAGKLTDEDVIIVHNCDVISDLNLIFLQKTIEKLESDIFLVCVPYVENTTPIFYSKGEISLVRKKGWDKVTYSGIGAIKKEFLGKQPLRAGSFVELLLNVALKKGSVKGIIHKGLWCDGGNPRALKKYIEIKNYLRKKAELGEYR